MFKKIITNIGICVFAVFFGIVFAIAVENYHGYERGSCKCHPHRQWVEYHRELIDYYKMGGKNE